MATTTPLQTITLLPGQSVYLPSDAAIQSITTDGDLVLQSDCLDVSNVEPFQCYVFYWSVGVAGAGHDVFDANHTVVASFSILGQTYEIGNTANNWSTIFEKMQTLAPAGTVTWDHAEQYASTGEADRLAILFSTAASTAETMKMSFNVDDGFFRGNVDIYPTFEEGCEIHE